MRTGGERTGTKKKARPAGGPRLRCRTRIALTLGVVLSLTVGGGDAEPARPAASVRDRVARLQTARRADLEEQAHHERALSAVHQRTSELQRRKDDLHRRVAELRDRTARARKALAQREAIVAQLSAALRARREPARKASRAIRDANRGAPPVTDPARARPFEDAARPGSTDVTPAETADGLSILVEACAASLPQLRTTKVEGRRVQLPDERELHAFVLRLGAVHAVFVSEDGVTAGAWNAGARRWNTSLTREEDRAVRRAVAIARGQSQPGMIGVPIWPSPAPLDPPGEEKR